MNQPCLIQAPLSNMRVRNEIETASPTKVQLKMMHLITLYIAETLVPKLGHSNRGQFS